MSREYDLVVLGGGPAGYPAAIRASQIGASVCLVEMDSLGGVCLNRGCIPTKTMHALAHLLEQYGSWRDAGVGGGPVEPDISDLIKHKANVVGELVDGVGKLLKGRKVDLLRGRGVITAPGELDVEGIGKVKGKSIIIATGSSEISLPGLEFDGSRILASTDLLDISTLPESLLVIGGGVIGCEFASIFNAFGVEVTIVEMLKNLVATEDAQVSRFLQASFRKKGINLHLGTKVEEIISEPGGIRARLESGGEVPADVVLVSVGRRPNVSDIGLENIGLEAGGGGIATNSRMETDVDNVYAAGDVVGGWLLAHVATREGIVAAENALGASREIDYGAIPSTIYTLPEISRIGVTEGEVKEKGLEYSTGRFPFAANGKARGLREEEGFVKWIAAKADDRLIGLHIVGPQAVELISAGIVAIDRGMKVDEFTSSIFPHPTLSEALAEAAEAVRGEAIHLLK